MPFYLSRRRISLKVIGGSRGALQVFSLKDLRPPGKGVRCPPIVLQSLLLRTARWNCSTERKKLLRVGARRKRGVPRASSPLQRRWRLVKSLNGSSRPLLLRIPDRRQSPWFPPQRENFHGAAPLCGYLRKAKCLSPANKFPHTSVGFRCCAMRESVAAIS